MAALVPVIGFFVAPFALVRFRQVVVETNDRWNPARSQLYLGAAFALLSMLLHALVVFVVFVKIIRDLENA